MDMLQVFHMNKGQGESSYAKNCMVQDKILSLTKSYVEEAIQGFFVNGIPETMVIADLGCSSGPTALEAVWGIIKVVNEECQKMMDHTHMGSRGHGCGGSHGHGCGGSRKPSASPKFMVFLNDLPGNDFNEVFGSLSPFQKLLKQENGVHFGPCFVAGLPGTFYGRLLPSNTLHFVHSSSSLHWLSQVPPGLDGKDNPTIINKGKIYLSTSSSSEVINAYKLQFRNDFLSFLKSRAEEVISGGRMVFSLMGSDLTSEGTATCYFWEFLAQCLMTMVSEGIVEEEKVDLFNVPYYAPCLEEIVQLVEEESSFREHRIEAVEVEWDGGIDDVNMDEYDSSCMRALTRGERIAKMHRAVGESMFQHVFGGDIVDDLYHRYSRVLDDHLDCNPNSKFISLVVSLIRN